MRCQLIPHSLSALALGVSPPTARPTWKCGNMLRSMIFDGSWRTHTGEEFTASMFSAADDEAWMYFLGATQQEDWRLTSVFVHFKWFGRGVFVLLLLSCPHSAR